MSVDCTVLLSRLIDGERLSEEESLALSRALDEPAGRSAAQQWLVFEAFLRSLLKRESPLRLATAKTRLLARAGVASAPAAARSISQVFSHGARLTAAGLATVFLLLLLWIALGGLYPPPAAQGDYVTEDGAPLRRGSVLCARAQTATLYLGGYAAVTLEPESRVRVEGREWEEGAVLEEGGVRCRVAPGRGCFRLHTRLGAADSSGGLFAIHLLEANPADPLRRKRLLVQVEEGTVRLAGPRGVETLSAGMTAQLPRPDAE